MRVAIFSDQFYPELSGITDSICLFGKTLGERGHHVAFVAPRYTKRDFTHAKLPFEEFSGKNITVKRLPSFRLASVPTGQGRGTVPLGASLSFIKKFKPDVIHVQSPFGVGLEALFVSKVLGIPLIGTNHTPPSEFTSYAPIKAAWFDKKSIQYFSWYYNRCRFVSTPCQSLLDEMHRFGFHKPGKSIANPVEIGRFSPTHNADEVATLKARFGFSPYTVLYTGRLADEKHIDVIIDAVRAAHQAVPDISLAICGHGAAEASLKKRAAELGISERVHFLGFVKNEVLPDVYKASDVFAIMSTAESQSLSLMQAFATGIPSVGARARALPEYITPECGVIVETGNHNELARTLVTLLTDKELSRKLGQGAITAVKSYSPEAITETWEKIYSEFAKL